MGRVIENLRSRGYELFHWSGRDGTFNDLSGNGNNLTPQPTALLQRTRNGMSCSFDGVASYLAGNVMPAITYNGVYSFAAWIYLIDFPGISQHTIFHNTNASADRNVMSVSASGNVRFGYRVAPWVGVSGDLTLGRWTHVVGVNNATSLSLYIDATPQAGANTPYTDSLVGFKLGSVTNPIALYYMRGFMDEVYFYTTALSSTQVSQHYGETHPWGVP